MEKILTEEEIFESIRPILDFDEAFTDWELSVIKMAMKKYARQFERPDNDSGQGWMKSVEELIAIAEMRVEKCKKEDRSCTDDGDNAEAYHASIRGSQNKFWLGQLMQLKENISNSTK